MALAARATTTSQSVMISSFLSTSSTFLPSYLPLPKRLIPPIFLSIPSVQFLSLQTTCCSRRKLIAYACVSVSGDEEPSLPAHLDTTVSSDSNEGVTFDKKLPRRSLMVKFTCNSCGERTKRIVNRLAYEKGTVFVQCAGCLLHHKLVDNLGLVVEYDLQTDDA